MPQFFLNFIINKYFSKIMSFPLMQGSIQLNILKAKTQLFFVEMYMNNLNNLLTAKNKRHS